MGFSLAKAWDLWEFTGKEKQNANGARDTKDTSVFYLLLLCYFLRKEK